ncbi:MAG: hypothetical protein BWY82_01465 [Verrucomicrobia bacterium ADurb.Bin474]|nr:MAG: hypothetical protein BWY82_01465 [Verrucomicrobia bacterium ADurb.Bin474]
MYPSNSTNSTPRDFSDSLTSASYDTLSLPLTGIEIDSIPASLPFSRIPAWLRFDTTKTKSTPRREPFHASRRGTRLDPRVDPNTAVLTGR